MPSSRSTVFASAARRRSVSRFPKPASTSRRVWEVSSKVQLPELPDARMLTRKLMDSPFFNAPSASCRRLGVQPNARSKSVSSHEKMRPAASSQNGGAGVNANSTPTCANAAHVGDPGRFERFCDQKLALARAFQKRAQKQQGGFAEEGRQADFQQARRSRFSSKPSSGPTTVAAILRGSKNSMAVCCTSSAVTASIEACNSSTLKKRPK